MLQIGGEITILDGNTKTKYIYNKFSQKYGKNTPSKDYFIDNQS